MAASESLDAASLSVPGEQLLTLSDGRTLAFASGGEESSRKIFLGLHGVFGVGAVDAWSSRAFADLGWRCISPTLPGWGRSSPWPSGRPVAAFTADVQELLSHAVCGGSPTHILVFGGSYGSVWAYAVAANRPPAGVRAIHPASAIRGLAILGGFSPYADDGGYAAALDGMTTLNWLTVGRPGRSMWLSWIHGLAGRAIRSQVVSGGLEGGRSLIRRILTGPGAMTPEERAAMEAWAAANGTTLEAWETTMARNVVLSVRDTLAGYAATPEIINSHWGFDLAEIRIPGAAGAPAVAGEAAATSSGAAAAAPGPDAKAAGLASAVVGAAAEAAAASPASTPAAGGAGLAASLAAPAARVSRPPLALASPADVPPTLPPVVIGGGLRDHLAPIAMQRWVAARIPGAQMVELQGNHISGITCLLPMLRAMVRGIEARDAASAHT